MGMATREAELFKDKIEVTLDGRQIFYLFFGGAVIACLVFVLGVTVGRRVEARANPPQAAAVAIKDPLAALDELDAWGGGELAFPAALRGGDDRPLGSVDERAARGELRAAAAEPKAAEPKAGAAEPRAKARPEPEPRAAEPKAAEPKAEPKAAEPKAVAGKFTLQLSSFQDRAEADAFVTQMKQAGYAPYVVQAEVEGKGTWFRVRVGDYASYDEAIAAKAEFESKQKMIAYVTRLK
jgi:DedD protein